MRRTHRIGRRPRARCALVVIASVLVVVALTAVPANGATGDIGWSRLSEFAGVDYWSGIATYGDAVYASGHRERAAVLRKYASNGSFSWTRTVDPGGVTVAEILGVAADRYGAYVAGVIYKHGIEDPVYEDGRAFVANYRPDGSQRWLTTIMLGDGSVATGIDVYGNGIYVVGQDNLNDAFGGTEESWVRRYLRSGELDWQRRIRFHAPGSPSGAIVRLNGVAATSDGIYVVGEDARHGVDGTDLAIIRKFALDSGDDWTDYRRIADVTSEIGVSADAAGADVAARSYTIDEEFDRHRYGAFQWRYEPDGTLAWDRRVTAPS